MLVTIETVPFAEPDIRASTIGDVTVLVALSGFRTGAKKQSRHAPGMVLEKIITCRVDS